MHNYLRSVCFLGNHRKQVPQPDSRHLETTKSHRHDDLVHPLDGCGNEGQGELLLSSIFVCPSVCLCVCVNLNLSIVFHFQAQRYFFQRFSWLAVGFLELYFKTFSDNETFKQIKDDSLVCFVLEDFIWNIPNVHGVCSRTGILVNQYKDFD